MGTSEWTSYYTTYIDGGTTTNVQIPTITTPWATFDTNVWNDPRVIQFYAGPGLSGSIDRDAPPAIPEDIDEPYIDA